MKKTIAVMLAVLMIFACLCGCAKKDSEIDKTFVVGFDASFPPYGYMDDNGDYVGFDLDLAAEVASRNGWELKLQPIKWESKDKELEAGTIDCIWNGFTMSEERLDKYTWSAPYVDNSQVVVVRADSKVLALADLAGKTVGVQAASSALEALNSDDLKELTAGFKELIQYPDYNTAFLNLEAGAIDAVAMDIGVANYQINQRGADKYIILEETLVTEQYGIGFLLGNTELCAAVEKTLTEMTNDNTFAAIAEKWGLTDSVIYGK